MPKRYPLLIFILLLISFPATTRAQVNIEKMRLKEPEGFAFSFSANYALRTGNRERSDIGIGTRIDYKEDAHYIFLLGNVDYGISQGETYKNRSFAHLRYNYAFSAVVDGELFSQLENDEFTLLQIRFLAGTGFRVRYIGGEKIVLYQGSSLMLEHESLDERKVTIHAAEHTSLRWNNYINARIQLAENVSFFNTVYVQPQLDNFKDVRLLLDSSLQFNLNDHFAFTTTLNLRYDSLPPDAIQSLDLELKNGIRLTF